jgi:hypothetical protein
MQGCNKMIVYYEQAKGIYGKSVPIDMLDDLASRYLTIRGKMLRLEQSWKKYRQSDEQLARLKK